jgi:hypothetical protein
MKCATFGMKCLLIAVLAVYFTSFAAQAVAADLPLAPSSPLTGVAFDDRPLILPVQRNFQMAMLTAGSELGRSCGKMEAYGWRMSQTEQARVNQIFNNTVDRMRMGGYTIAPQKLTSISNDITLFTADRSDRHFIFLWSAGELGLVMTLCETSAPVPSSARPEALVPSVQVFQVPNDVVSSHLENLSKASLRPSNGPFSPVGEWIGGYTCAQGFTGGTLKITHLNGKDFEGEFKFYSTPKNQAVPSGAYTVYGQYDSESSRILINPGKWLQRPSNYYNTVIVGAFDPAHDTFSAYFQGISGCTSFEAKRAGEPYVDNRSKKKKIIKKKVVKKTAPKPKMITSPSLNVPVTTVPAPSSAAPVPPLQAAPAPNSVPLAPSTPVGSSPNPPSTVPVTPPPASTLVPISPPALPSEDKTPAGITLTAPVKN